MWRIRFFIILMGTLAAYRPPALAASCIRILKTSEVELMDGPQAALKPIDQLIVTGSIASRLGQLQSSVRSSASAEEDPNASPPPPMDSTTDSPAQEPAPSPAPAPTETFPPPFEPGQTVPLIETEVRPVKIQNPDATITEQPVSPVPPTDAPDTSSLPPPPPEPDQTAVAPVSEEPPPVDPVAETAPPKERVTITVNAGQIYAGVGKDPTGKFVKIKSERKTYLLPVENGSMITALDTCNEKPICLVAKRSSFAIKNLADPDKRKISFRRNDKIPTVASRITQKKEKYYLTFFEKDYYWVNARDVATYTDKTCEEVKGMILPDGGLEDTSSSAKAESRYSLGFEGGYGMGYTAKDYSGFITEVPDSTNVGPLSNPIITEVKKGKGFYFGPLLEVQINENYKLKFGVQYQEKSYTYKGKDNPTIAPNSLDSLPDIEGTFKDQSILFSVAPAYEFGGAKHRFGLGAQLRTAYYISKPSSLTYRVGSVFKATEVTIEGGPKGFQNLFLLNGYYQWHFDKSSPLRLRSTIEADGTVFNLGLAIFY